MTDVRGAEPRVSVVMPVFNGEAYLAEAVESVLSQTLADLELVVVDDGSTDGSHAILEGFVRKDPRVRLIANEENLGLSAARNRGWRAARASYVAWLDADDVALPDRLFRQVELLDAHPTVAVVGGATIIIDATGRHISTMRFPTTSRAIRSTLRRHNCLAQSSITLRRAALEEVGGYRFDQAEDYDLWLRISERFDLVSFADPVTLYRLHPGQLSLSALEERVKGALVVRAAAKTRLGSGNDPLAGVGQVTPALLDRLGIDSAEFSRAFQRECVTWASLLTDLGRHQEAKELVAQASRTCGPRTTKAFAAAAQLRQAQALLATGRRLPAISHVVFAFWHEPRYAFSRTAEWLGDRLPDRS